MVHEIVGRINGRYGTLTENPIHHLDRQLSFHELCALYAVTDVLLVASLRDGMNLVSYEYVACQSDNAGESGGLGPTPCPCSLPFRALRPGSDISDSTSVDAWFALTALHNCINPRCPCLHPSHSPDLSPIT